MSLFNSDPLPRLSVILGTSTIFVLAPEGSDGWKERSARSRAKASNVAMTRDDLPSLAKTQGNSCSVISSEN